MAPLVLKMSISLDGYVAPPDGSGGWKLAGRSDRASGPFAEPMNEIPKVVFSNSG